MKKAFKFIGGLLALLVVLTLGLYLFSPRTLVDTISNINIKSGGFSKHSVEIDGEDYYYYDNENEGKEVLLFLHGFSDEKASWFPFVNDFSKEYRVITPDLLGHGENTKDSTLSYNFVAQADFIKSFIDQLGLSKPNIIGISMGGGVAGNFASKYPNDLQSITFISSAGINGNVKDSKLQSYMNQYTTYEERKAHIPLLPTKLNKKSIDLFKGFIFYKKVNIPTKLMKAYLKRLVTFRDFYFKVLTDIVYTENGEYKDALDEKLGNITVPVLIIWGIQDPLIDVSAVKVFEDSVKAPLTVALVDECGHATIAEQPEETRQPIIDFLDNLSKTTL